jgi:hypothetical protein
VRGRHRRVGPKIDQAPRIAGLQPVRRIAHDLQIEIMHARMVDHHVDVASWPIASFRCAAEFGRYQGIADSSKPTDRQIYGFTA